MKTNAALQSHAQLSLPQVMARYKLSRYKINRAVALGLMPAGTVLGPRTVVWDQGVLDAFFARTSPAALDAQIANHRATRFEQ